MSSASIAVIALVVVGFGGCGVSVCISAATRDLSPPAARPAENTSDGQPDDGTIGYLHYGATDTLDVVAIYPTKEELETKGGKRLGATIVPVNTAVLMIGGSFFSRQVSVTSGPSKGKSGWVDKSWVHKSPK